MPWPLDRKLFDRFCDLIDAESREWLRDRDFGEPFEAGRLAPFRKLALGMAPPVDARSDPKPDHFHRPELRNAFAEVQTSVEALIDALEPEPAPPFGEGPFDRTSATSRAAANAAAAALTKALGAFLILGQRICYQWR